VTLAQVLPLLYCHWQVGEAAVAATVKLAVLPWHTFVLAGWPVMLGVVHALAVTPAE